jgi:hypothetical protein
MIGIKEARRYKDISWLMSAIDVVDVLERMGAEKISINGDTVQCLCPDHFKFVNRISSHPNWICNIETGVTYCRTEPRGSNLLYTVSRVLDCPPKEAIHFMTGKDYNSLQAVALSNRIKRLKNNIKNVERSPVRLDDIQEDLENRYISEGCYRFFLHPPGKEPTNIRPETVDMYRIFERRWGYYSNRAIVPFFKHGELVGFVAIDLLGKDKWLIEHPVKEEDEYKKALYPLNFQGCDYLFGMDDCQKEADFLIVTEGAREVMKLHQEGFPNSVGCLKADLSDGQILILTNLAPKKIILMFDGDEAGYSAIEKNAKKLEPLFKVQKCFLPVGKDPKNLMGYDVKKYIFRG